MEAFTKIGTGLFPELAGEEHAADVKRARAELIPFTRRLYPDYRPSRHHEVIADALQKVSTGEIKRLIITMPPRHGKSELASVNFPAWHLARNPDDRIIAVSYGSSLANRFSRQARDKFRSPRWPFPEVRLSHVVHGIESWEIAGHRGGYQRTSIGGAVTGMGANILIIDDPHKDSAEARRPSARQAVWDWYQGTAHTRLEAGGRVVVIATRWHHDDLIGRLIKGQDRETYEEQGLDYEPWTVIHLPALALSPDAETGPDLLDRAEGEALWPERYPRAAMLAKRIEIGAYQFAAQYQGTPTDEESTIFKAEYWRYYPRDKQPPMVGEPYQFVDTSFGKSESADYSVIATWATFPTGYGPVDIWRGRPTFPELKQAVVREYDKWRPEAVVIEDKASGQSLIQELRKETRIPIITFNPGDKDKVARAHSVSAVVESGRVLLPSAASWLDEFVQEHREFPSGANDDTVDTTVMALLRLARADGFEQIDEDTMEALSLLGI